MGVRDAACDSNHALVLDAQKRIFSWGFRGYSWLGHTKQEKEMVPRLEKLCDFPISILALPDPSLSATGVSVLLRSHQHVS